MTLNNIPDFLYDKQVLVVMNGPDTSKLDIDHVNDLISRDELIVIIINGALANLDIVNSKNVIYFINDPIMYYFVYNKLEIPLTQNCIHKLEKNWPEYTNHLGTSVFHEDIRSINLLRNKYKNITLCVNKEVPISLIKERNVIKFQLTFFLKLWSRFSYIWGQDGREPSSLLNKYGFKFFPYESYKKEKKNK